MLRYGQLYWDIDISRRDIMRVLRRIERTQVVLKANMEIISNHLRLNPNLLSPRPSPEINSDTGENGNERRNNHRVSFATLPNTSHDTTVSGNNNASMNGMQSFHLPV